MKFDLLRSRLLQAKLPSFYLCENNEGDGVYSTSETPVARGFQGVAKVLAELWMPRHLHGNAVAPPLLKQPCEEANGIESGRYKSEEPIVTKGKGRKRKEMRGSEAGRTGRDSQAPSLSHHQRDSVSITGRYRFAPLSSTAVRPFARGG